MAKVAITRALISVYDKTGLEELAAALHRAGVEIVSTGKHCGGDLRRWRAGDQGRGPHRIPRVPGRPGQDAAPPRCTRGCSPTPLGQSTGRSSTSWVSPRSSSWSRICTRSSRPWRAGPGQQECVEQIDIGGPAMVRAAAKNHAEVAVVTDPSMYPDVAAGRGERRLHAGAAAAPGGTGLRAHGRLRRRGRLLVRVGVRAGRDRAGHWLAGRDRRVLDARERAQVRREPAPARGPLPAGRAGETSGAGRPG